MNKNFILTSESVSEGHPDKMADQIADAILDDILRQDLKARVACECLIKTGVVFVGGEITTSAWSDIEQITRQTVKEIGYCHSEMGFDWATCAVLSCIGKQSADISQGVTETGTHEQGAGDQGMMIGYATNETEWFMPAPIMYAHLLMKRQAEVRKKSILPWLRPDGKSQISLQYENGKPVNITSVILSTQHDPYIDYKTLTEAILEEIIKPVIPAKLLNQNTQYLINPTGRFVIGGPLGDTGLTGRKIIVDTYGGVIRHGGGCFSGKDPSKVDRSATYMARYVAKNIVAAGLADRCEISISYAIGVAEPTSLDIETFGTGKLERETLLGLIREHFSFKPRKIIETLDLLRPIYKKTAAFGHFGREEKEFTWERLDKVDALKESAKKFMKKH